MTRSWIKLHRSIIKWGWYISPVTKSVFIHLLLKANIEERYFEDVKVCRGQLVTSYSSLADQLGISVKQVRTALRHLKTTGEISVKPYHKFSLITVVNYNKFQCREPDEGIEPTNK